MQKIFIDIGKIYTIKLAEAQAARADKAMAAMAANGATVVYLSEAERKRWADKLPNVPMQWAASMEKKGLPGETMLKGYLDGLRARGVKLARDWDK
jgi:TRAP-type C4-dicarboxylate transport system substrate-binding protein